MGKSIFITGIAGFIGFHLALFLRKRGDFVIGCDNFNAYYEPALKQQRTQILQKSGIDVIASDICNAPLLQKLLIDHDISHFVHLAAQAGVRHSIQHPESYVHTNLDGFVQVLEVCRRHPTIPFIYASSSSVYGLNTKTPFAESDSTDLPASLYGATKKSNELIAHAYHHLYGIRTTGLRYFTVYGPWGRPDMAYFSFARSIARGEPIQVYNQGAMERDFTYIDDIVMGTAAAIDLAAPCEIFNLGNNHPEPLLKLIDLIEKNLDKKATILFAPLQAGDVLSTCADIAKGRKLLGFAPKVSLQEGIERFISWLKTAGI